MSLQADYPWTSKPLIVSAAMGGFAFHNLATAVSLAGGLGFIGSTNNMPEVESELQLAKDKFDGSELTTKNGTLPLGVGFILFAADLEAATKIVEKYRPAAVWFFAAKNNEDYKKWTERMRVASPESKIWIQNGLVSSALEIANACKPDVLVMQGIDAGGHGYEKGAGVISLVPETLSALADAGLKDVKVVASGGISDGRSVAGALALGASGVVMGTRFLASEEVAMPAPGYRDAVLHAFDGGKATTRDKLFDELKGPNFWPAEYDGRSLIVDSYTDFKGGMAIDEVRRLHKEAEGTAERGFSGLKGQGRAAVWVGTGVGFAKSVQRARDIVEEVRRDAIAAFEKARVNL
jgi:nitronate monooxygenase